MLAWPEWVCDEFHQRGNCTMPAQACAGGLLISARKLLVKPLLETALVSASTACDSDARLKKTSARRLALTLQLRCAARPLACVTGLFMCAA